MRSDQRVTEDLVRKRAEHNECEISTLEEVSLHQQEIERIENLDKWCRDLKILYLQSNIIPKIENVSRLKKLQYLNLALNNVEKVENLEACESLEKLDLTVNFVGELTSIECLAKLPHFRELYLTGNPCCDFEGYRKYVIATLKHLKYLDGVEIDKSERILATQEYDEVKESILKQQDLYKKKRAQQILDEKIRQEKKLNRQEKGPGYDGRWYTDIDNTTPAQEDKKNENEMDDKEFWDEKVPFTPESRLEVHEHMQEKRRKDEAKNEKEEKAPRRLMDDEGNPLNVNEAKVEFAFLDDENNNTYVLDLSYYRHMDSSLLDVDVQPNYVRVIAKSKVFQLRLDKDIKPDDSTCQRSQVSGHLLITMPKASGVIKRKVAPVTKKTETTAVKEKRNTNTLEIDPSAHKTIDYGNIVTDKVQNVKPPLSSWDFNKQGLSKQQTDDYVNDSDDVPPLI